MLAGVVTSMQVRTNSRDLSISDLEKRPRHFAHILYTPLARLRRFRSEEGRCDGHGPRHYRVGLGDQEGVPFCDAVVIAV